MSTGNELVTLKQVDNYYKDLRKRSAPVIFNNAIGNPVVFSDGADGLPIQSLKVHLLPRQEGTGDPSPENIRSIVPWNGVDIFGGGKNLVGCTIGETRSVNGIDYTVLSDGGVNCEGTATASSYGIESKKIALPSGMYTFSVTGATNAHIVIVKNNTYYREINGVGSTTFSLTEETVIHFYIMFSNGAVANETVYVQLEAGQIATVYEPFVPITETDIEFQSPVYGGMPDVARGKMKVTWGVKTFDGSSDEVWYFVQVGSTSWYRAYIVMNDAKQPNDVSCFADSYEAVSFDNRSYASKVCMFGNENESPIIFNVITEIATFDAFTAYLAENPLTIAYKLAEPYEVDIDSSVLTSLYGNNTIWSDANGDIEVEYRADTELFLKQNAVQDVKIQGTSILDGNVAKIPIAGIGRAGVMRVEGMGVSVNQSSGELYVAKATDAGVKAGTSQTMPIVPSNQHISAFYALAKLAGADMAQSSNPVGTYVDAAKAAIQKMFGFDGILGDYELSATASKAYAVGDTFIFNGNRYRAISAIAINDVLAPGTNCVLDPIDGHYVKDTDYATSQKPGIVQPFPWAGLDMNGSNLRIFRALTDDIKAGTHAYRPITPSYQHISAFYALAKLAGVDLASSDTPVGTYTAEAKAAILAMLGANGNGLQIFNGTLATDSASTTSIKNAANSFAPIVSSHIHDAAFFGLAKAAGADMASISDVTVGQYPQAQKTAIQTMLGIEADIPLVETVTGATASITGMPNVRYICDTAISELTITPPASGSIVVRFTAGSNCIVALPQTVKLPEWFDISSLESGTTYEIIITDGVYGGVMSWA